MSRFAVVLTCAVLIAPTRAPGGEIFTISGNWDIVNNTNGPANDFHMTIRQPGGAATQLGDDFYNDGFFDDHAFSSTAESGPGTDQIIKLDWLRKDKAVVPVGRKLHLGYTFLSNNPNAGIVNAYWTNDREKIPGEQPVIPGFRSGSFDLTNDNAAAMVIEALNFRVTSTAFPLAALMPYTLPGFGTSLGLDTFVPTFTIPAGGAADVLAYLPALPSGLEFLSFQFTSYPVGRPDLASTGMYQRNGPIGSAAVPEPATLSTASAGAALVIVFRARRRSRST